MSIDTENRFFIIKKKVADTLRRFVPWFSDATMEGMRNVLIGMLRDGESVGTVPTHLGDRETFRVVFTCSKDWNPLYTSIALPAEISIIHSDTQAPDGKKLISFIQNVWFRSKPTKRHLHV